MAGVALCDTARAVVRLKGTASDADLAVVTPMDVKALLRQLPQCKTVVVTGGKAESEFAAQMGTEQPRVGTSVPFVCEGREMTLFRMPSSSRAYPMPLAQKADIYKTMFGEAGLL